MKNISFIFLFFSSFIFAQTSQVTVYDEYGNDLGTYTVQSNYAEQNSNNSQNLHIRVPVEKSIQVCFWYFVEYISRIIRI